MLIHDKSTTKMDIWKVEDPYMLEHSRICFSLYSLEYRMLRGFGLVQRHELTGKIGRKLSATPPRVWLHVCEIGNVCEREIEEKGEKRGEN